MWNLPPIYIYMHCTRSREEISFDILVCKASMLDRRGGPSASYPYVHCTRTMRKSDLMSQYARHLCWIMWGSLSACYLICIVLYVASELIWCTLMQGIYAQQMGGNLTLVSECAVLYIYRSAILLHVAVKLIYFTVCLLIIYIIYIYIYIIYIYIYIYIIKRHTNVNVSRHVKLPFLTNRCQ